MPERKTDSGTSGPLNTKIETSRRRAAKPVETSEANVAMNTSKSQPQRQVAETLPADNSGAKTDVNTTGPSLRRRESSGAKPAVTTSVKPLQPPADTSSGTMFGLNTNSSTSRRRGVAAPPASETSSEATATANTSLLPPQRRPAKAVDNSGTMECLNTTRAASRRRAAKPVETSEAKKSKNTIDGQPQRQGDTLPADNSGTNSRQSTKPAASRRRESSEATAAVNTNVDEPQPPADTSSGTRNGKHTTSELKSRRRAAKPVETSEATVSTNTMGILPQQGGGSSPPPEIPRKDQIAAELAVRQRIRLFCIVSQSRCDRSMDSLLAGLLGYAPDQTETDRKAVFKLAGNIRRAVEAGKPYELPPMEDEVKRHALERVIPMVTLSAQSRAVWDHQRDTVEQEMRQLAAELPVYAWVKAHAKGVGDLGLARIIGSAPKISLYATHAQLWKRMGVAVVGGERQQRKTDTMEGLLHGYSPKRRAELWSVCSDSMFRQQWRRTGNDPDSEDVTGIPVGPYGEVYRARKAYVLPRIAETEGLDFRDRNKWTRKRCDQDARRVMSKEFLRDLWRVWHGMEARHPARWTGTQAA